MPARPRRDIGALSPLAAVLFVIVSPLALASTQPVQPIAGPGKGPSTGPTTRAVLIDRALKTIPGSIVSLNARAGGAGEVDFIDDAGKRSTISLATLLAIAPPSFIPGPESLPDEPGDPDAGVLELADGQRFVGTLMDPPGPAGAGTTKERPALLRHNRLGVISTPLDAVARYLAPGVTPPASLSTSSDTVIISTGDRLEGLVDVLGPTVTISPSPQRSGPAGGQAEPRPEPVSAPGLVFAKLSNPPVAPEGLRVWLADGTVVASSALSLQSSAVSITTGPADAPSTTQLLAGEFRGLVPDAARLLPLAALAPASVRVDPSRPFGDPPRIDDEHSRVAPLSAPDVLLPGPMSVEWALPAGVSGVLGTARLDTGCSVWGDCRVVVELVSESGGLAAPNARVAQLAAGRLAGTEPSLSIRATFDPVAAGARLRVTVSPGNRGPIQDRVLLSRMLLVTSPR